MTATPITAPRCPKCGKADSIDLDAGERLCLSCRNEWNPATSPAAVEALDPLRPITEEERAEHRAPTEPSADALRALGAETIEEVLALGSLAADPDFTDATDWCEQFVRDTDGRVLVIIADDGTDTIVGQTAMGEARTVSRAAVEYLGDDPVGPDGDVSGIGENEPMPQTILAVAGLVLTVANDAVSVSDDGTYTVANPRIGWLPPPCNEVPEAECGVAYACALLISIFGLDKQEVAKLAANLLTGAESGTENGVTQ